MSNVPKALFCIVLFLIHWGRDKMAISTDDFWCIFLNEKFCISTRIAPKFVPKGPNDNKPALVQVMAWRRSGEKRLSEPMLVYFTDTYAITGSYNGLSPVQRQGNIWTSTTGPSGTNFNQIVFEIQTFSFKKMHLKMSSKNADHIVSASMCW